MNPPLHDVALHHHQSAYFPRWVMLQRAGLLMTTALTLGISGYPIEAAAFSDPSSVSQDNPSQTEAISLTAQNDELINEQIANSELELINESETELEINREAEAEIYSTSDQAVETLILEHEISSITSDFQAVSNASDVEEVELNQISQNTSQTQPASDQQETSLVVVDAPMITTESVFNSSVLLHSPSEQDIEDSLIAQSTEPPAVEDSASPPATDDLSDVSYSSQDLENPLVQVQGVYTLQGNESSARARVSTSYAITPNVMVGGTIDVTTGDAFSDSPEEGIDLNELYVAVSPTELPNLRFIVGMLDLTSYFDRNSFAKDAATHFLNPVFQSNPALAAAGLGSRPAILMNWSVADPVEVKLAGFSSDRDLGDFALDGFAGEVGVRLGNLIVRGTYITGRDAGQNSGFREIFQIERDDDEFGLDSDDREQAFGINAEYFIPEVNLGLFARYGWYENLDIDRSSSTFSVGFNLLDLFMEEDRLGLAYGQQLSNSDLRQDDDDDYPDAWELFYDFQITPNLRAGVTLQSINQFSETIGGFRIRADFDSSDFRRLFR